MILFAVVAHLLPCSWSLAPYYTEQQQALRRRVEHAFVRGWQVRPNGHVPVFLDAQRLYIRDGAGSYVQVPVGTGRALSGRDMYRWAAWQECACGGMQFYPHFVLSAHAWVLRPRRVANRHVSCVRSTRTATSYTDVG